MRLPLAGPTRVSMVGLGWAAAAVVAGLIGITAIGAVGDGIVGFSSPPLSAEEVDRRLAASASGGDQAEGTTLPVTPGPSLGPSPSSTPPGATSVPPGTTPPVVPDPPVTQPPDPPPDPPPAEPPPASETKIISTAGGSIVTRCQGASPQIVSATPAQRFEVKNDPDDGEGRARVEFESEQLRVRVEITCSNGQPDWTVETD
ncbi:MAG: hypothetical protein WKH47_03850 [Actinomycetes bacterium]